MLVEQLYKHTKDHWPVHLKWVDRMLYVEYPIKLLIKRTDKGWYSGGNNCRVDAISGPEGISRGEQVGEAHLTGYTSRLWPLPVRRELQKDVSWPHSSYSLSPAHDSYFQNPTRSLGTKKSLDVISLKSVSLGTELGASWCVKHKIFCVAGELRPGKEG